MLIIKHVSTQELRYQVQTLRSCPVNGNSRLDPVKASKLEITSMLQDIYSLEFQKTSTSPYLSNPNFSRNGMEQDVTPTIQLKI
jgi:hypothetical protein